MYHLIDLPYSFDALEPVISSTSLELHHGKHLKGYVDNLNKLTLGTEFETLHLEEIVRKASGAIFNNAGQILNHNLYFTQFSPGGKKLSEGPLKHWIVAQWGKLEIFQEEFVAKGTGIFGSGWVWLAADHDGLLTILQCYGADNPVTHRLPGTNNFLRPLLTFDVWEHAYYLDYQNRRNDYLNALWKIVDWAKVEARYSNNVIET